MTRTKCKLCGSTGSKLNRKGCEACNPTRQDLVSKSSYDAMIKAEELRFGKGG